VLVITTEYPTAEQPGPGIFVARQVRELRRLGVLIDVLHFPSRGNPLNHLRAWRELRRRIRGCDYDLIHAQFGHAGLVAQAQRKLPVVVTFRGPDLEGVFDHAGRMTLKGRVLVALCRRLARTADEVVVVSETLARRLPRKDYHVVPSGLDLECFSPAPREQARRALGWDLDQAVVLFAAQDIRMPGKRFALAREAVEVAQGQIDLRLEVATDIEPGQMPLHMNASDALMLTSISEGSPNVVKEALACNLPVISVDVGDVRERLAGVSPGAICEATPQALAEAMIEILERPRRSNGRHLVAHLDEHSQSEKVLGIYNRICSRRTALDN